MVDILSPGTSGSRTGAATKETFSWRSKIKRMLEKGMTLDEIAESLNHREVPKPHGSATWTASLVRKAFVS